MSDIRPTVAAALAGLAVMGATRPAHAQDMVPPLGTGVVAVTYQTGLIKDHVLFDHSVDVGHIKSHALMIDFGIGLGRNFALSASVPFIAAKYTGDFGHRPNAQEGALRPDFTFIDDGRYHSAWQDLRLELRYALERNGLHAMPFVTVVLPTHDYEYLAHAAVGRRVREVRVGLGLHRLLSPWSARSFVQSHVAYAFQERIAGVSRGATHLNIEGGRFMTPDLTIFAVAAAHLTHGGIDIFNSPRAELSGDLFISHDRIVRERLFNLGAGASYSFPGRLAVSGSITRTVWGMNGHAHAYVLTIGLARGFGSGAHGH